MKQTGQLQQDKRLLIFGIFVAFLILSTPNVSAFALSTPHWDTNPLPLTPGESRIVEITLQNKAPADSDDIIVEVSLSSKDSVAIISTGETTYDIPYGTATELGLLITIPESAEIGDEYDVRVSAKSSTKDAINSGVGMNIAAVVSFPVIIVEKTDYQEISAEVVMEEKESPLSLTVALTLLVILIILIVIITKVKGKKKK